MVEQGYELCVDVIEKYFKKSAVRFHGETDSMRGPIRFLIQIYTKISA